MSRKRVKFKRKSKHRKEDKSKIIPMNDAQSAKEGIKAQDEPHILDSTKCVSKKEKSAKQVHIAFLSEKYQPLVEEDVVDQPRDDNIKKKQHKCKSLRKNVGKALRYSWKCLVVGLQNLSTAYSMPLGVAATIVPDIQRTRSHV
ncbi:required for drug-induced death protein 1 [Ctenopharyngodon idella]|uniref:required for drug-induced death protein 1 n=1 Tax=Ctenopharyngodon idella TaxID=7959 RepID=UPI0022308356|nr:required for drug-induced death protein 1 [Ctenopharyngodon idella]